mgnify:CR=1 FL=1
MTKALSKNFFNRSTLNIAQELLGKFLVRKMGRGEISGMITEVEAYVGPHDKASHASRGKTKRTKVMFGKPGHWYLYLIYGMHYCLNIVTEEENYPAAVLIRSVDGVEGPGRVCRHFRIDKRLNEKPASKETGLWIENRGVKVDRRKIKRGKRIGVDYAGKWKNKPWRFYFK